MDPVKLRLLNQQLLAPQFDDPAQVVGHLGAMQAQEYRLMRWAVAMRTKHPSSKAFEEAFNQGKIVRLHLLRGTWQVVTGADYWWMHDLFHLKAKRVIEGWMKANKIAIPDEELHQIRDILIGTTEQKGSAMKEDYEEALAARGIAMDDHRLSYHIRYAELSGTLCSGDLQPMKATYALTDAKIGPRKSIDRDEALANITRRYFQSRQPATLEDYVWWSGLSKADCRRGIEALGRELHTVDCSGYTFYLTDSYRNSRSTSALPILLPSYDEYLLGYKSREIVLPPQHQSKAHSHNGIFFPIILHDGIACGNWSPFLPKDKSTFFDGETHDTSRPWAKYQQYLTN